MVTLLKIPYRSDGLFRCPEILGQFSSTHHTNLVFPRYKITDNLKLRIAVLILYRSSPETQIGLGARVYFEVLEILTHATCPAVSPKH